MGEPSVLQPVVYSLQLSGQLTLRSTSFLSSSSYMSLNLSKSSLYHSLNI